MNVFFPNSFSRFILLRYLLPPFCFVLALCVLVITFQDLGYSALPPSHKRYTQAKAEMAELAKNPEKAKYRSSWEKLHKDFTGIYTDDPSWPNRPAALFRAAEALEGLARHSFSSLDAKRAAACFERLAAAHPVSPLADDALYRAAKLHAAWMRDDKKALDLLQRIKKQYPRGDMLTDAQALEKTILAARKGQLSSAAGQVVRSENKSVDDREINPLSPEERLNRNFNQAKKRMQDLMADSNRSCWRQPWENLESDFLAIHKASKNKEMAARALYLAAESRHSLAGCSHMPTDFRGAQELYQSVPENFPTSSLADDALFKASEILRLHLRDQRQARRLLTDLLRRYPNGDKAAQARTLLARAADGNRGKSERKVELEVLTWNSPDKNRVQITLELSGKTRYSARLVPSQKNKLKHLYLELSEAEIAQAIRRGVAIQGSLLQGIYVENTRNKTPLLRFDLRDARRFDIVSQEGSNKLVVTVDARKNITPRTSQSGVHVAQAPIEKQAARGRIESPKASPVYGIAEQLGLSIQTVVIDAGHGGKDPGTYHNNVVEKLVAMDVAKTLGRLLENNGLTVIFTRSGDNFISLSQRTAQANLAGADLFISVHVNASDNPEANGFETYYLDLARSPEAARVAAAENVGSDNRMKDMQKLLTAIMLSAKVGESASLARDIQRVTLSRLKRGGFPAKNNGIKSAPFHVLLGAKMPAVLVELGYCTNAEEAKKLTKASYRELLARGLAEGIMAYRARLARKHTVQNSLTQKNSGAM